MLTFKLKWADEQFHKPKFSAKQRCFYSPKQLKISLLQKIIVSKCFASDESDSGVSKRFQTLPRNEKTLPRLQKRVCRTLRQTILLHHLQKLVQQRKKKNTRDAVREIDGFLHRNREILATIMHENKKLTLPRIVLDQAGFRWKYCTGTYLNKEGKTYFIIYDYAWMEFSNQEILLIRNAKTY